jgi:hypothetical protein
LYELKERLAEKEVEEDSQSVSVVNDKEVKLKVASLKKLDTKVTEIEDMLNNELIKYTIKGHMGSMVKLKKDISRLIMNMTNKSGQHTTNSSSPFFKTRPLSAITYK